MSLQTADKRPTTYPSTSFRAFPIFRPTRGLDVQLKIDLKRQAMAALPEDQVSRHAGHAIATLRHGTNSSHSSGSDFGFGSGFGFGLDELGEHRGGEGGRVDAVHGRRSEVEPPRAHQADEVVEEPGHAQRIERHVPGAGWERVARGEEQGLAA